MEEPRGNNSAEEYRLIQGLAREGCYREALERAELVLQVGNLGRKHAAKLSSLICWLYSEALQQPCPAGILHGEEAVRLSHVISDEWVRGEALLRLISAYCRVGDTTRARAACQELGAEMERNPAVLDGGFAEFWSACATMEFAAGEDEACLRALDQAMAFTESGNLLGLSRLRARRAPALLGLGRQEELSRLISDTPVQSESPCLEWVLTQQALRACTQPDPEEARRTAGRVLEQAIFAGRADLARRLRQVLAALV